jgi:hypothetical protein
MDDAIAGVRPWPVPRDLVDRFDLLAPPGIVPRLGDEGPHRRAITMVFSISMGAKRDTSEILTSDVAREC